MIHEHTLQTETERALLIKLALIVLGASLLPALPRGGAVIQDPPPVSEGTRLHLGKIFVPASSTEPVLGVPSKSQF
ncbi:MAG: hypothetical protein LBV28_03805 [Puniceicoccales bacterium]|jgi:hypothetical protein|nr:hypothetical protein [Puniceicoccales bacterium]